MPFCAECGTNLGNGGNVRFCPECGTQVASPIPSSSSVSSPVPSSPPSVTSSGSNVSNRYLPGSLGSGGDIESNLSKMLGMEKGPQPTKYTVETKITRRNQNSCTTCGLITTSLYEDNGKPYCEKCLQESGQADTCTGCGKAILDGSVKKVKDAKYHPDCLRCHSCSQILSGSFVNRGGKWVCKACAN